MSRFKYDLDTEISLFSSLTSDDSPSQTTVGEFIDAVKTGNFIGSSIKEDVLKLRETNIKATADLIKQTILPCFSLHGNFFDIRAKTDFHTPTGIIIIDIDDLSPDEVDDTKELIMEEDISIIAAMTSPSGDGIKCLYLVEKENVTAENYRGYQKILAKRFSKYGKTDTLSLTDCLIYTYDPNILVNEYAIPNSYITIEEYTPPEDVELEERMFKIDIFEDPEEFFETVLLNSILEHCSNNFEFIRMSVFELAKFGFKQSEYDLSFVINHSEENFKPSNDNEKRFDGACEVAEDIQQSKWPYDTRKNKHKDEKIMDTYTKEEEKEMEENEYGLTKREEEALNFIRPMSELKEELISSILEGKRAGLESRFKSFSNAFRPAPAALTVVTGISGHGKSEFSLECLIYWCLTYNVKAVIFGSEEKNGITAKKAIQKILGRVLDKEDFDKEDVMKAFDVINSIFTFIDHGETDEIQDIIDAATALKKIDDSYYFIYTDPYNQISANIFNEKDQVQLDKKIMSKLTRFVSKTNYHHILVAHPRKSERDEDSMPGANSVAGSQDIRSKTHNLIIVHWHKEGEKGWDGGEGVVEVKAVKVKQANWGEAWRSAYFHYDLNSTRYEECEKGGDFISRCPSTGKTWINKIKIDEKNENLI
jgi:replicative DNA helicase